MTRMRVIILILIGLSFITGCSEKVLGKIGEEVKCKIFFNDGGVKKKHKATTEAVIKITKVELMSASEGLCNIAVYLEYTNTGKTEVDFGYSFATLKDSKGRIYNGQSETDLEFRINKMWDRFHIDTNPFDFINCGPGLTCRNSVSFEVPDSILEEDIYFGFMSSINKNKFQCRILLRDNKKSTRKYGGLQTFESSEW